MQVHTACKTQGPLCMLQNTSIIGGGVSVFMKVKYRNSVGGALFCMFTILGKLACNTRDVHRQIDDEPAL